MIDQAEALRTLVRDRALCCGSIPHRPKTYVLAVTSGKGGVGKTSIAVNLALLLGKAGRRVRLVDADFGLSNAEVMLGVSPKYTLGDIARGLVDPYDAWVEAAYGVKLISSGSGLEDIANIGSVGVTLIDHVLQAASDGDIVIIDTAPGINESVMSVLSFADEVMVVTTPEPTSITDSYAAIKVLVSHSPGAEITLVANQCISPAQAGAVAKGIDQICLRFLKRSFQRYEYLPLDAALVKAVRSQKPVAMASSNSAVTPWLKKVVIKLDERVRSRCIEIDMREMVEA